MWWSCARSSAAAQPARAVSDRTFQSRRQLHKESLQLLAALVDMHSVANIINVLINELDYLQEILREAEPLQPAVDAVQQINHRLRSSDDIGTELGNRLK